MAHDRLPPLDKGDVARSWKIRSGPWNRWAGYMERMAERFNQPLLDAAQVAEGHDVLDLASGVGEPALSAARRVGAEGSVTATDLVSEMLDGTRRRAGEAGLANMKFETADMEALPFTDASFDRVTCRFGIMFSSDPVRAAREVHRVLKPGGRCAWMVWGPMADTTLFDVIQRTVRAALDLPADPDLPQFRFGPAGLLADVLGRAGFVDVAEEELWFHPKPAKGERFWEANLEMSFAADLADLSDHRRAAVDRAVVAGFDDHLDGDAYALSAHVRIGTGVRAVRGETDGA